MIGGCDSSTQAMEALSRPSGRVYRPGSRYRQAITGAWEGHHDQLQLTSGGAQEPHTDSQVFMSVQPSTTEATGDPQRQGPGDCVRLSDLRPTSSTAKAWNMAWSKKGRFTA